MLGSGQYGGPGFSHVFGQCYVQSLVCVMNSLESVLCLAFIVSGSPLKRLVAVAMKDADFDMQRVASRHLGIYIYRYMYTSNI